MIGSGLHPLMSDIMLNVNDLCIDIKFLVFFVVLSLKTYAPSLASLNHFS